RAHPGSGERNRGEHLGKVTRPATKFEFTDSSGPVNVLHERRIVLLVTIALVLQLTQERRRVRTEQFLVQQERCRPVPTLVGNQVLLVALGQVRQGGLDALRHMLVHFLQGQVAALGPCGCKRVAQARQGEERKDQGERRHGSGAFAVGNGKTQQRPDRRIVVLTSGIWRSLKGAPL